MFTIEYEPEYARAQDVLDGCSPLGALSLDDGAVIVGDCSGKRRIARIRGGDAPREELAVGDLMTECNGERLLIGGAGFRLALTKPLQRIETLLPDELAPRDAQAVWTGHALLVGVADATERGHRFRLHRYVCDRDTLRRTDARAGAEATPGAVGSSAVDGDGTAVDPFGALSCNRD
jgi:hypothetical protein